MERVKRALALYINYFLLRRTPTLVYSVERSGSVAILHSLQSHGVFAIGAHYLSPEKLAHGRHGRTAVWASKHIIGKRKPAKVISMVRNPIDNMLSTFAREYYGRQDSEQTKVTTSPTDDDLSTEFCRTYLESNRYRHILNWFEREFEPALGIDIYQHPFDEHGRFAHFRENPYDVLILGTELEDEQKSRLVADFVGVLNLDISNAAVASQASASNKKGHLPPGKPGEKTAYAERYRKLKQQVVIPKNYLDAIVDSRYVKHFFSEQEREVIRSKYGDKVNHG